MTVAELKANPGHRVLLDSDVAAVLEERGEVTHGSAHARRRQHRGHFR